MRGVQSKSEREELLTAPSPLRHNIIKMYLMEIGMEIVITYLVHDWDQGGFCELGNEPSDSVKGKEFLEWRREYYRLKKDAVPQ